MPRRMLVLGIAMALGACAPSPSAAPGSPGGSAPATPTATTVAVATGTPAPTPDRIAGWRSDIAALVPGMDRLHPDLGHGTPVADLEAAATQLSADVPTRDDDELLDGVLRIVAMVSAKGCDAHTGAFVWGTGTYPVDSLPLRLWLFGDDVVIVDALPPYEALVGLTIDTIDGRPIATVLEDLDPLIPRDNEQTVRLLTPRYLLMPQVLRGLGLIDEGAVSLGMHASDGRRTAVDVDPVPMATYNAWAGPYGLHLPADPNVLYLSRIDDALWWQQLPTSGTLLVQSNRMDRLPSATISDLRTALHGDGIDRIVLDLRHNFGGEVSAIDPLVGLFEDAAVNQPGRLFVITGRNTFSAGSLLVARLAATTEATIVGEPMGGCPTAYGNSSDMTLPFSGIAVSVAGMLEVGTSATDPRDTIRPDLGVELTRDDWASGSDPALGSIATYVP